jgi:hypothetical protein
MSEHDPGMILHINGGEEFLATPENSTLYSFVGHLAIYDHAFFVKDEEEGAGFYIFNQHPSFDEMAQHMMENDYPAHLNLRQVAECDILAFDGMVAKEADDLDGGIPDDWLNT